MDLREVEFRQLEIPFRVAFKHAAAERASTEAVLAVVSGRSGEQGHGEQGYEEQGYGEGCPRFYVTGESIQSCQKFLATYRNELLQISSLTSLREWTAGHTAEIDANPAAWCALETAMLDLLGKVERKSIDQLLGLREVSGEFHYTGVLGVSSPQVFHGQLSGYVRLGINDLKIKLSGDLERDRTNLQEVSSQAPAARIRFDANNLWREVEEASDYLKSLATPFWAVEEPLEVGDYQGLRKLAERCGCKIILDESFLRISQLGAIRPEQKPEQNQEQNIWIPNIRISKMGGLLRAIAIAEQCRAIGMKFIIGCQVGETSILTRVALSLANEYRDLLLAQEGAFGTHLLAHDIVEPPLTFAHAGALSFPCAGKFGLGLRCNL